MMVDPLSRQAEARPERLALWTPSHRYTYADILSRVAHVEDRLKEVGIREGARVGLHLSREAQTVVGMWALWRVGAVVVPLSTRLPPAGVVRRARRAGCRLLVTADPQMQVEDESITIVSPDRLLGQEGDVSDRSDGEDRLLSDDRPATIVFTSGSTGTPKAVLHTWGNHRYSAKGSNANIPLHAGDRWVLSLPLYHVGGIAILIRCAIAGAAVAIPPENASLGDALRTADGTHVSLVATQLRRLMDEPDPAQTRSLRAVLLGGGPIPDRLLGRATRRNWPVYTSYGSTEMASQITTTRPGAPYEDLCTAGRRLPHRRLRIREGQIYVRGATLGEGYVTQDGIEDLRTEDGWYATGDRGGLDAEGRLHILGRTDRMFISGGENVQPEEVETALEALDQVKRAVVVPIPDEEYGARPVAFVDWVNRVQSHHVERALRGTLPGFKIPDAFHSLPSEARSDGLKIDRELLRRRARNLHR